MANQSMMKEIIAKAGGGAGRGVGKAAAERNKPGRPGIAIKHPNAAGKPQPSTVNSPQPAKDPTLVNNVGCGDCNG